MVIDKAQIKRILVITLSNVGDIILATPVIRTLAREFPSSRIDVMVGPKGKEIFEKDPRIFKVIIYDKHLPITEKRRLQLKLKKLRYDIVADIRNTIFPLLIGPKYRTSTIQRFPKELIHRKERHLYKLASLGMAGTAEPSYIHIPKEDEDYVSGLLEASGVRDPIVLVSPGAKSHLKRWPHEAFALLSERLAKECGASVIFIGQGEDKEIVARIRGMMKAASLDFVDRTNIRQLAALARRAALLVTNDSAPLHIGCAVGTKVLALFGPTDPRKYGPTGEFDAVIGKKLSCSPCEEAVCRHNYECMKSILPDEVFETAKMMIEGYGE
jgi:ADP-heptose:LPS heptosyltransferase